MHLTLKQETASPPRQSLKAQQRAFNKFMRDFNEERPHEALAFCAPTEFYQPSHRPYPPTTSELVYPPYFAQRKVRPDGAFKWRGRYTYLTEALDGHRVGLLQTTDEHWHIYFGTLFLAVFDEPGAKIIRPRRTRKQPHHD